MLTLFCFLVSLLIFIGVTFCHRSHSLQPADRHSDTDARSVPPPQEFSRRDTPPTYEQVLQEDAAVLAGFGLGSDRSTAASAPPPLGADLIDFDAPAPAPSLPPAPLTWDSPPPARQPAPSAAPAAAAAAAPLSAVTVIRPVKSAARRFRQGAVSPAPTPVTTDRDASPPMPSCPPPPPPTVGTISETPALRPPTPPPRPGSSAVSAGMDTDSDAPSRQGLGFRAFTVVALRRLCLSVTVEHASHQPSWSSFVVL